MRFSPHILANDHDRTITEDHSPRNHVSRSSASLKLTFIQRVLWVWYTSVLRRSNALSSLFLSLKWQIYVSHVFWNISFLSFCFFASFSFQYIYMSVYMLVHFKHVLLPSPFKKRRKKLNFPLFLSSFWTKEYSKIGLSDVGGIPASGPNKALSFITSFV